MKHHANDDAPAALRAAGLRATPQRLSLYRALAKARAPQSIEALLKGLRAIDTATAYRSLAVFVEAGLARRVTPPGSDRTLFEASGPHHHHLVCTRCGLVEDIEICVPSSLAARALAGSKRFARIDSHELEFVGICRACIRA